MRKIGILLVSAVMAMGLAGCHSSTGPTSGPLVNQPTVSPVVPAAAATTAAPAPAALPHTAKFDIKSDQGHTATAVLRQGDLVRADKAQPNNGLLPGAVCQIQDKARSAAVPISITLTSTTQGFGFAPGIQLVTIRPPAEAGDTRAPHLYIELVAGDGNRCADVLPASSASNPTVSSGGELAINQSVVVYGWLVAANYVTPEHPQGNPEGLKNAVVQIQGTISNHLAMTVTGGAGSIGLVPFVGQPLRPTAWGIAWDPANSGGCYATVNGC